jgi:hypothetical protein
MKSKIMLRGHHLASFAEYTFKENRGLRARVSHDYSEEFYEHLRNVFDDIADNPQREIEIVKGIEYDAFCSSSDPVCPKKNDIFCVNVPEDGYCLTEYGLEVGDVISSEELLKIIKEYQEQTDFSSPKEKLWFSF